jgi:hypothetical protein
MSQLADELDARLVGPVRSLLGVDLAEQLADRLTACAPMLAGQLTSGDDRLVAETVIDVMLALWGTDDPPRRWWRTPLGVRCAASLAGQRDGAFSRRAAADMLDVHVGTVDQLLSRGTLERHPDGGVTAGSVLARVARLHGGDAL